MDVQIRRKLVVIALSLLHCLLLFRMHLQRQQERHRRYAQIVTCIRAASRRRLRIYLLRRRYIRRWILRLSDEYSPRRWWAYPRPTTWWTKFVTQIWGDEQWQENFRMPRRIFFWLLSKLQPRLERHLTRLRRPIPPDERLAIALWFLANGACYRLISQQFGVARSTICGIVIEVCLAMEMELLSTVVRPGPPAEAMNGFEKIGFPHCVGAIDGTHIYIRAPPNDKDAFVNRKKRHSVVMQATVNHAGLFVDVSVGNVGRDHDSHVLRCSNLFDAMDDGVWVPGNPFLRLHGVNVPALILGDAGYPIRSWLMTPYEGNLTLPQGHFNRLHNRARSIVERSFGRLKMRWRCLLEKLNVHEENINSVICACVILHNLCECTVFPPVFGGEGVHDATLAAHREPPHVTDIQQHNDGKLVRDALCEWLYRQRH